MIEKIIKEHEEDKKKSMRGDGLLGREAAKDVLHNLLDLLGDNDNDNDAASIKLTREHIKAFILVEPILRSALDGHNVCIMAYGQTGTCKTFTLYSTVKSVEQPKKENRR
ncbi:hypothetical protein Syun_001910 [Stephania yunnanensis]|uniref:Kinesin motor domain-containing protein n=1 Tax=Stephania yunnanensis TaxID=152371 RepID=A0AAP0LHQ2_9MAGN